MRSAIQTDWISPAQAITGRDHLAVQAVSEHLYAGLLPGLTNVTERARCYAFYPWFVWSFERLSRKKSADELVRIFRRAECLHTLIGILHELDTNDAWSHGAELAGRLKLVPVARRMVDGDTAKLSQYARPDAAIEDRYFKHRLGGLGQYYLGPLKELEVLDGNAQEGLKYTKEWGATLAEIYNKRVDGTAFFKTIDGDRIDVKTLRSLSAFCPCHLRRHNVERDALVDLLFSKGTGDLKQEAGKGRRQTLLLLLDYARRLRPTKSHYPGPREFLASCYTGFLPDGNVWDVSPGFRGAVDGWGIYQRHELLALAVQGLFWGGLTGLLAEGGYVADATSYAQWFAARFKGALGQRFATTPFAKLVEDCRGSVPSHSEWNKSEHELYLGNALLEAQNAEKVDKVVALSIRILLSLLARGFDESPYGELVVADRFFETYEINLLALRKCAVETWKSLNGNGWLEWLAASWALRVHFRVALRKLRYQMQDTFRIVPLDEGYRVREAPPPQWSSPRLAQALRFLYDLGALDLEKNVEGQPFTLSAFGEQFLEGELARK